MLSWAGRGGAARGGKGCESKRNNGPVTIEGARILLQVVCPQRKLGLQGSSFHKQRDCLTVNAMAYCCHLFSLYIHCPSQRCVTQRRVAFRGMGKADRRPVVECIEVRRCSGQSGSKASSSFESPPTCVLTTQSTKHQPNTKTEKIIFDDNNNNNNNNNNNIHLTAIGLSPGGSGFEHIYKYLTLCY